MVTSFEAWIKEKTGYTSAEIYQTIVRTGGYREYKKIMAVYEKQFVQEQLENENPFLTEDEEDFREGEYL